MDEIQDSKQYRAMVKLVGEKEANDFLKKAPVDLDDLIAKKTVERQKVINERDANDKYKLATGQKKAFDDAARDTVKPINTVLSLATKLRSVKLK